MYGKGFLGNMTENLQADCVQSRQAGFIQRFPSSTEEPLSPQQRPQLLHIILDQLRLVAVE